jgi:hypothetical protein
MKFCHIISLICVPSFLGLSVLAFIFYSQFLYNWQGIRDMCLLYTVIVFLDGLAFTGALLGVIGAKSFEPEERKARAKVVPFK